MTPAIDPTVAAPQISRRGTVPSKAPGVLPYAAVDKLSFRHLQYPSGIVATGRKGKWYTASEPRVYLQEHWSIVS